MRRRRRPCCGWYVVCMYHISLFFVGIFGCPLSAEMDVRGRFEARSSELRGLKNVGRGMDGVSVLWFCITRTREGTFLGMGMEFGKGGGEEKRRGGCTQYPLRRLEPESGRDLS